MKRLAWLGGFLAAFFAVAVVPAAADILEDALGEVGAFRRSVSDETEVLETLLPGPVLSVLVAGPPEGRFLLLLMAPPGEPDGERSLYLLDPAGEGAMRLLRRGVPGWAKALASMDLDADGEDEVLLAGLGTLDSLGPVDGILPGSPVRRVLEHPGFDLRSLRTGRIQLERNGDRVYAAEAGILRVYEPDGKGGLRTASTHALPLIARRTQTGLALASPEVTRVRGEGADDPPVFLSGPEPFGTRRLRTTLLSPYGDGNGDGQGDGDGDEQGGEAWALLPAPERVEQSWYERVGGRLVLFAVAQSADKIGIFESKRLRSFPLIADRTRAGKGPLFTYETDARRWFQMSLEITDMDADGRDDLVLVYPEGMGGGELLLEAFPGLGGGRFLQRPRRAKLDPIPNAWRYGSDLTGDGLPDLLTLEDTELSIYPGREKGKLLEKQPERRIVLPRAPERPEGSPENGVPANGAPEPADLARRDLAVVDLDGDGKKEILRLSPWEAGRDRLFVVKPAG